MSIVLPATLLTSISGELGMNGLGDFGLGWIPESAAQQPFTPGGPLHMHSLKLIGSDAVKVVMLDG